MSETTTDCIDFVFLGTVLDRYPAYRVAPWGTDDEELWMFYWHEAQKNWVSLRKITRFEARVLEQVAIPQEHADIYHRQHHGI